MKDGAYGRKKKSRKKENVNVRIPSPVRPSDAGCKVATVPVRLWGGLGGGWGPMGGVFRGGRRTEKRKTLVTGGRQKPTGDSPIRGAVALGGRHRNAPDQRSLWEGHGRANESGGEPDGGGRTGVP